MQGLRFGVFGLGNRKYEHFCATGKLVHRCMLKLGANPIVERGDGNDDDDIDTDFDVWKTKLYSALDAEDMVSTG